MLFQVKIFMKLEILIQPHSHSAALALFHNDDIHKDWNPDSATQPLSHPDVIPNSDIHEARNIDSATQPLSRSGIIPK